MKTNLLFFFALALIPFVSSAQEKIEVTDPEIKFSYTLPEGWEVKDDGYTYEIHSPEVEGAYITITYIENAQGSDYVESLGAKPSFDEDFDFEIRYVLPEENANFEVGKAGKMTIDETPARWVEFQSKNDNNDMKSIFYMFPKFSQTFKITSTAPADQFEKVQPMFTSIIKSLKSSKV